jgi:hypothetical protein
MSAEIELEVVPGLPGKLPAGESIVWQGRPQWWAMARNTFKVRWLAAYFAVFGVARFVVVLRQHQGVTGMLHLLALAALAGTCLGLLALMAWFNARATIYTITTRRIVMRIGVALPFTWNLPFKRIASADVHVRKEGDGDIVLRLAAPDRIGWLHLWPHTQPGHVVRARPTLRTIAEPARVSQLLADAVRQWASSEATPVKVASEVYAAASSQSGSIAVVAEAAAQAGH